MAQATAEVFEFPAGGIADFYMEDHEIEALEREEAKQEFGSSGIATFEPIAKRMASYGRFGDDTVAHVETGELVVPKALIDDNPRLRDSIFSHLRELGIEDPERYVVGSGVNSINPETGMPEFFNPFKAVKKAFEGVTKTASKIVKGVSKALKGVTKVIKKAAPVIIPFALNIAFPALGAIYSGALGAGIGTLVQGGNLKDAFKNALIGGAIGGATAAIGGGFQAAKAGGSFSQGAMSGIQNAAKFSNLQTAGKQLATGQFGQAGLDAVTMDPAAAAYPDYGQAPTPDKLVGEVVEEATTLPATTTDAAVGMSKPPLPSMSGDPAALGLPDPAAGTYNQLATTQPTAGVNLSGASVEPTGIVDTLKGYGETAGDYLFRGGQSKAEIDAAKELAGQKYVAKMQGLGITPTEAGLQAAEAAVGPGMIATYGPSLALAGGATYLAGGFTPQELDEMSDEERLAALGPSAYDEYMANKAKYDVGGYTPTLSQGQYVVPTAYPKQTPILPVAEGGEIFPRRVGGIMPNEGTPGKDSVKAMLMPGEFVMTTNAVKGLGDGDNNKGISRMYDMMRGLEAKGKAMA